MTFSVVFVFKKKKQRSVVSTLREEDHVVIRPAISTNDRAHCWAVAMTVNGKGGSQSIAIIL